MRLRRPLLLMLALFLPLVGCDSAQRISDEDLRVIDTVSLQEIRQEPGVVLVDVRTPEAYQQGHLAGAINIPLPEMRQQDRRLAEAQRIVVYGRDVEGVLSAAAAKKLTSLGYSNVYDYRPGFADWQKQGLPVEQAE